MLIDWFTVVAQIINFIILVGLLKRFLFKPVLKVIDERENLIAQQVQEAEKTKSEAQQELESFQQKNKEFDQQSKVMLDQAKEEADKKRIELIKSAKQEYDEMHSNFIKSFGNEQQRLTGEIKHRLATEVFSITRKMLKDLASANLEELMVMVFVNRLHQLDKQDQDRLTQALKTSQSFLVNSSFELSTALQAKIISEMEELTNSKIQIRFEVTPQQISGIQLTTENYKLAWSITDYLSTLEKRVLEGLTNSSITTVNPT